MTKRKVQLLAAMMAISTMAHGDGAPDPRTQPSKYVYAFYGQAALILGSEDVRYGGGFGLAYGKPEPKFSLVHVPAQLVFEGYFDHTRGADRSGNDYDTTHAVGALAMARWFFPKDERGWSVYGDLGWGLQYANHPTHDLNLQLNSTPMLGFGGLFPTGRYDFMIGIRLLHISNGGIKKPNRGQNELFLTVGFRF